MSAPIIRLPQTDESPVGQRQPLPELRVAGSIDKVVSFREAVASRSFSNALPPSGRKPGIDTGLAITTGLAIASLIPVALRQFRVIRHLPDPNSDVFNSDRIVTSKMSKPFGIHDSVLGMGSYGATLALVLLAPRSDLARTLVGPKLAIDTANAAFNTVRQVTRFERVCSWCLLTVAATAAMAVAGRRQLRAMV